LFGARGSAREARHEPREEEGRAEARRAQAPAAQGRDHLLPDVRGSGIVATELGRRLACRGDQVHFISMALPYRLPAYERNVFFHEVTVRCVSAVPQYPPLAAHRSPA
jgi:hypothetical protein